MPRYFFHLKGFKPFVDHEGVELVDDDAAWSEAIKSLGELLKDIDGHMLDRSELAVVVCEGSERQVAVLRFAGERGEEAVEEYSSSGRVGHLDRQSNMDFRPVRARD